MLWSQFLENFQIALQSIKGQLLRTILTALIISFGIMALVGILTAIDAIKNKLTGDFALLGANTFSIQNRGPNIRIGREGSRPEVFPNISYYQAMRFKSRMNENDQSLASVSFTATGIAEVKHGNKATNPNIRIMAVDENFMTTGGYELATGRTLTEFDLSNAAAVAIIGTELENKLFTKNENPIGKMVQIGGQRFKVVGTLKSKGNSMGFSGDKLALIPISKARTMYPTANRSFAVNVMALSGEALESAVSQATALMRAVRKLAPKQKNNFSITKSDSLSESLIENLSNLTWAAIFIAAITLLGAAIALMNIMLVSVTERTREIGIRKAIGANSKTILTQFLTEAVVICLLGGAVGVLFGIAIGNATSLIVGGSFIIPWLWMAASAAICLAVGLLSGLYPAYKASRLDPIESLRYE